MLVPFAKARRAAVYHGASSPGSEGRMPRKSTDEREEQTEHVVGTTGTTKFESKLNDEVDGALEKHDTNYPRSAPEEY